MTQSHYSLRWNNHQSHILAAFDALLQAETLVDVTLVCAEASVRAHKVVLSACSPFFQRIFAENPCKHPVIVLKDFSGWEVQAIVDFMYKGEISVGQEQLQSLIKAAESLQVRGLANQDPFGVDRPPTTGHESIVAQTPTPSASPTTEPFCCGAGGRDQRGPPPFSPPPDRRAAFPFDGRGECQSPVPRRKQARPRRRSGELGVDLSGGGGGRSPEAEEMLAENLCVKRREDKHKDEPDTPPRPLHPHHHQQQQQHRGQPATPEPPGATRSPDSPRLEYRASPGAAPHASPAALNLKRELEEGGAAGLPFPPMPSVSALAMTQPPHSKFFGLDSPLGLFPPGLDRNPLFDMPDPRTTPDAQMFAKKKMGRPKGQHSAPRGGPPRSWTNAELTEALQHVWNKKMTTSQASRIFGIPYNSLLMYVRGKYGKSLKLEQLRKDCIGEGGPAPPMDILSLGGGANNNNTPCKPEREQESQQNNNRPPSREIQQENQPQHPIFNPFQHSFYPDFGTGFPIPVSMVHLLPQSEKSREGHYLSQTAATHAPPADDDCKKEEDEYDGRPPPPAMQVDDHRRELVHQNGQD